VGPSVPLKSRRIAPDTNRDSRLPFPTRHYVRRLCLNAPVFGRKGVNRKMPGYTTRGVHDFFDRPD